ncbi:MAG: HDOD domain-containing protein [Planctomycetaceae bacterium]
MASPQRRLDERHELPAPFLLPSLKKLRPMMEMTHREDLDFGEFAAVVEQEAEVASRILREARSIAAGRDYRVDGVQHAVAMIGMSRVRRILETLTENVLEAESPQLYRPDSSSEAVA